MKVIITAAGFGKRFADKGIKVPKFLIKVKKITLGDFFDNDFIFVFRDLSCEQEVRKIIDHTLNSKNQKIKNYQIINLSLATKGQADTVIKCKNYMSNSDEPILVFNIDTSVTDAELFIKQSDIRQEYDGIIYTVKAIGNHWSFARTINGSNMVIEVAEKYRESLKFC